MAGTAILIHFRSHRHRRFLLQNATSTVRFYSSSDDNPISSPNSDYSVTDIKTTENTRTTSFHNPIPTKVDFLEAFRKNLEAYRKPVQPSQSLPLSYQELYQRSPFHWLFRKNLLPKPDTGSGSISQELNEIVDPYFHLNHISSAEKQKLELKKVRDKFKVSESDCGSARVQEELNERLQKVQEMEEKEIAAEPIGPLREGLKKLSCVEQTKTKEEELDERLQKVREVEEKEIAAGPFGPLRESLKKLSCVEQTKTKEGSGGCLYVKVSMDGAPYLRTIDLKTFHNYAELFKTIEKMFSCFTLGHPLSEGIKDGSECVLTYEDKDGDWMLVGDVPWEMFIDSCKRLRIMKTSKAIG